jgi:hypothetical protein
LPASRSWKRRRSRKPIELTRKFLEVAGGGECELRQVFTAADAAPAHAADTHAQLVEQIVR